MCKEWSVCFRERKREECLLEGEEEKCSMDDRMNEGQVFGRKRG